MSLPEKDLQAAIVREVVREKDPRAYARREMRNFRALDRAVTSITSSALPWVTLLNQGEFAHVDELTPTGVLIGTVSASANHYVMVAPVEGSIAQVDLVSSAGIAADATDKWTVAVKRIRAGSASTVATKTTNDEAMTADTDWNFDAAAFANETCVKGDVVRIDFTKGGSVSNLTGLLAQVRFEPT